MAQAMTFPRELERNFLRDMDKEFLLIWFLIFVIFHSLTWYMQGIPPKEMSAEDVRKYAEVIYRVQVTKPVEAVKEETTTGTSEEVVEEVEEAPVEEAKPVAQVDKVAKAAAERSARKERQEAKRRAIADRIKILAGPTAKGGRARSGARARSATIGLSEGGGGFDITEMVGMVGDAGTASKVKKIRGGGALGEDIGDISIEDLRAMSAEDLDLMLNEAPMELSRNTITAKGRGSKAKQRSQTAISEVVLKNKNQVQYCYWTLKRRDSNLNGRVVVEFTISPAGEVIRVRFRQSQWGGNRLGKEVERCIKNILTQWHFDPIAEKDGNVTAGATYIFE